MPLVKLMSVEPTDWEPVAVEGLLYFVSYEPQIHASPLPFFFLCSEAAESRVYTVKVKTVQNLVFSYFCNVSAMRRGMGESLYILKGFRECIPTVEQRKVDKENSRDSFRLNRLTVLCKRTKGEVCDSVSNR